jgi:hypothetical protein
LIKAADFSLPSACPMNGLVTARSALRPQAGQIAVGGNTQSTNLSNPKLHIHRLIFAGKNGITPINYRKKRTSLTSMLCRPELRIHDVRHWVAASLLRSGVGVGIASQIMGHRDQARGSNWFCVNLLQNVLNFNPAMVSALGSDASICRCSASAGYPTML